MKCIACGNLLENFEYQTRSADEAQTTVTTCPSCPISAGKLDSISEPITPARGIVRSVRRSLPAPVARYSSTQRAVYTITFDIPDKHPLMSLDLPSQYITTQVPINRKRISTTTYPYVISATYCVKGILEGMCTELTDTKRIGIGAFISSYIVFSVKVVNKSTNTTKGTYTAYNNYSGKKCFIYQEYGSNRRTMIIEMGTIEPVGILCENIVRLVYADGIIPTDIRAYINQDAIKRLSNLSARAWDASAPPEQGYIFTCKPDGQRVWLVWQGHVWYMTKPMFKDGFVKWYWTDIDQSLNTHIIVDAEFIGSRGFIVIDYLTDSNGNFAPASRDIDWVKHQHTSVISFCPSFPLRIRNYFPTYEAAFDYCNQVRYPTDGVVAVRNGSTEILKIKTIKSMELVVADDNKLVTADGDIIITNPLEHNTVIGDIIEIRFTICRNSGLMCIEDAFPRIDKTVANSSAAVTNIIRSTTQLETADDSERRVALLWCNDLRKQLVTTAISTTTHKPIIIDVGTGTGQSLDSMEKLENVSYIFIEPDTNKCKSIARRTKNNRILTSPHEIVPVFKSLKTRSVQSIILNFDLSILLSAERISDMIFADTRAVISTFSMHYVVPELLDISERYDVPIYGCGYVYDRSNSQGILIDTCGVTMKQIDNHTATVKWGGDVSYTEPVTMKRDYTGIGSVLSASDVIGLPSIQLNPRAYEICRNIIVVFPR